MVAATKFISNTLTWTGTKMTKLVGKKWQASSNGAPALTKLIEYPKTSPLAQMGINKAVIENAGQYGKKISLFSDSDCLFSGLTSDKSFIEGFRKYCNGKRHLVTEPVSKIHHNELSVTTTASGAKIKKVFQDPKKALPTFMTAVYYPESGQSGRYGLINYGVVRDRFAGSAAGQPPRLFETYCAQFKNGNAVVDTKNDFPSALKNYLNSLK